MQTHEHFLINWQLLLHANHPEYTERKRLVSTIRHSYVFFLLLDP